MILLILHDANTKFKYDSSPILQIAKSEDSPRPEKSLVSCSYAHNNYIILWSWCPVLCINQLIRVFIFPPAHISLSPILLLSTCTYNTDYWYHFLVHTHFSSQLKSRQSNWFWIISTSCIRLEETIPTHRLPSFPNTSWTNTMVVLLLSVCPRLSITTSFPLPKLSVLIRRHVKGK